MKKLCILVTIVISLLSCNNNKNKNNFNSDFLTIQNEAIANDTFSCNKETVHIGTHKQIADEYINTITGFTCVKAMLTDNDFLIIAIDAISGDNYDFLASQFLDEAKSEGLTWIKGVKIVDSKNSEFQQGTVVGDRIGEAY